MSRFQALITDIYDAIAASPEASAALGSGNWLDTGLPPSPDQPEAFPVMRLDGVSLDDDKLKRYPMLLKLWAVDDGNMLAFMDLAEAVKDALNSGSKLLDCSAGYVPRHERDSQLFCVMFNVVAYLG